MSGIVVGVDGSGHAQKALDWAVQEAGLRHLPLTVLVINPVALGGWGTRPIHYAQDKPEEDKARANAQEITDQTLAKLSGPKPESVTVRAVSGVPAEELIKASDDADMIVVGARGAGGFKALVVGSVSNQVAHHAVCPVVIIPAERKVFAAAADDGGSGS